MKVGVLRLIIAPNLWRCSRCGGEIKAGHRCGKQGGKPICYRCLTERERGDKYGRFS